MNILIVTQYFYPENFKSNDLAFELKKRGHQVTVLTGLPNYPEGKIYEDYGVFKNRKQQINGVDVVRSLLIPRGNGGGIRLFINYYSFVFFASIKAFFLAKKQKFDAVIVHEPSPIMQFYPALMVKRIQKTPIYFWVMDLWPESLATAGGIENKLVLNYFKRLVIKFYKHSEKILISSKGFRKSILEKGDFSDKIVYYPNWAEETISQGDKNYKIPELPNGFCVMFAGNVGEAQDMDTIMEAALLLKDIPGINFVIIGDGRKKPFVDTFIEENSLESSVHCVGRYPVEAMASFFNKADVLLVSLKDDEIFNLTVPAKVQAYMSSGKPILAMLNGEGAETIEEARCGFSVPASKANVLAEKIVEISKIDKNILNGMGKSGKVFFDRNYKLDTCISNLEKIFTEKWK